MTSVPAPLQSRSSSAATFTVPKPPSEAEVKSIVSAFDKACLKEAAYDCSALAKVKVEQLPENTDVKESGTVFGKWATASDVYVLGTGFALTWKADENGGLELFDQQGTRIASRSWGDSGLKEWVLDNKDDWFNQALDDSSDPVSK